MSQKSLFGPSIAILVSLIILGAVTYTLTLIAQDIILTKGSMDEYEASLRDRNGTQLCDPVTECCACDQGSGCCSCVGSDCVYYAFYVSGTSGGVRGMSVENEGENEDPEHGGDQPIDPIEPGLPENMRLFQRRPDKEFCRPEQCQLVSPFGIFAITALLALGFCGTYFLFKSIQSMNSIMRESASESRKGSIRRVRVVPAISSIFTAAPDKNRAVRY